MKTFLERIPIPLCGVILAIVSLGNLLNSVFSNILKFPGIGYICYVFCGGLTVILMLLMLLKFVVCFHSFMRELHNPEIMSIFSTFSLSMMILAGYLPEFVSTRAGEFLWWFGVLMHYTNMVIFTDRYVSYFKLSELLPPWYIVYVGFALSGFNAVRFAPSWFGIVCFWVGFICFWIIFFLLILRNRRYKMMPMYEPTLCITAAIGICLTTYLRNFTHPSVLMIAFLFVVSQLIWIWLIVKLPVWLKLPFYPTDAAFSFPFVVVAVATLETSMSVKKLGIEISAWANPLVLVQTAVAVCLTLLVLWRYIKYLAEDKGMTGMEKTMKINMMSSARALDGKVHMKYNKALASGKMDHMNMDINGVMEKKV